MAGLHFDITGDNKNLLRNIEGSKQGIRSLTREAEKESLNLDDIMKRIGQSAAAIGVGFSATQLIRDVARVRGEFQQLEVALNTMLGSEEKANALFQQLVNTAAKTPFDLKGVAGGAKQLLAYGVAAEEVNDTIIRLGDIAAGLSIPLGNLVYLYGTTMTQGRLFTQDLRQFMGRGIPLADELAKQFGVAKDEVGGLVTAGKVGFPEVEKAIRAMTNEGGKFAGLMENQSKTITGQISNLEDAVDSMFNEIGKSTQGAISGVLSTTTKLVENYEKVGEAIGVIVTMYGTYKAAQAIHIAMMKAENAITAQAILLKSQYAKAGHLITDSMARGAAKSVLFADAQKRIVTAMKTVGKTAGVYGLIAIAVTGVVYGIYKLVTAKSAEEKAIERVNKKREEENKRLEYHKNKVSELISTIKDETRTTTEQANAYEELKKVAPKLTEQYTFLELQAVDSAEALKKFNEQLDRQRFTEATKSIERYRAMLKEVEEAGGSWNNLSEGTRKALDELGLTGMTLDNVAANLKAEIKDMQGTLDDFYKGIESRKPIKVKLLEAEGNVVLLQKEFDKVKAEFEKAEEDLAKGDIGFLQYKSIEMAYQRAEKALQDGKNMVGKLQSQLPKEKNYGEEYKKAEEAWLKAKEELDKATENRTDYTLDRYKEIVKAEKDAADAFKALGGETSEKKKEKEAEKDYSKEINKRLKGYIREKEQQRKQYEELLEEFETYEQARERIAKEYAEKREQMVNDDGSLKAGFTQGNIDNLEAQQRADEEEIDQMFVEKNEVYKGWLEEIEKMTLDNLREALVNAQFALELAKARGNGEGVALAEAQVEKLQEKIKDVSSETDPKKRSIEEWKALSEVISEASGVFEELGDSIGDTAGEILKSVGSIGSSTVGLINNITQLTQMSIEGTNETANTASKAVQSVEKASVRLAIISAAIQIITKIINLGKQLHNAKYEKAIEASQDKIDDLSKSYENLAEKVDEAIGNTRVQELKEMNANLERQNALIRQQMEDEKQVKQKDSEYEAAMDEYNAQLEENKKKQEENKKAMEEAIFGEDIQSAIENFADAYAEALEDNMDMNATAKEQAVRMMKNMVMESIKEYVAGSKKMEQIRAKMDALYADGVFSAADQKLIINELEQFNKELDDRFGWAEDLFNEEEASSSSSKRGIATASQESVDENNGRLMSIQLSMGEIKEQMIYTVTYLASMSSGVAAGNNILSDIREQAVRTNGHLEDIVKYTKPLNDKISEVVSAVNKINSK